MSFSDSSDVGESVHLNIFVQLHPLENPADGKLSVYQEVCARVPFKVVHFCKIKNGKWLFSVSAQCVRCDDANDTSALASDSERSSAIIDFNVCKPLSELSFITHQEEGDTVTVSLVFSTRTLPFLYLSKKQFCCFFEKLKSVLYFKRMSKNCHIVAQDKSVAWSRIASIFKEENSSDLLARFAKNPYSTTMSSLAKVKEAFTDLLPVGWMEYPEMDDESLSHLQDKDSIQAISYSVDNDFQMINPRLSLPDRPKCYRGKALDEETLCTFQDSDGSITDPTSVKSIIFEGGIKPDFRHKVWKYLLGVYDWRWSSERCDQRRIEMERDYEHLKAQWKSVSADQESRWSDFRKFRDLIEKDVARTDRNIDVFKAEDGVGLIQLHDILMTYMMYNFDLGYVQGMSDFLAPLICIFDDEVDSFWAFIGLMRRSGKNFHNDQLCILTQLRQLKRLLEVVNPDLSAHFQSSCSENMIFCFRWILILFKREFDYDDICLLWEVLWTDTLCPNFHLLFCLAILETQKEEILSRKMSSSDTLKHINNLAFRMDVNELITIAQGIYHQLNAVQNQLPSEVAQILNLAKDM